MVRHTTAAVTNQAVQTLLQSQTEQQHASHLWNCIAKQHTSQIIIIWKQAGNKNPNYYSSVNIIELKNAN